MDSFFTSLNKRQSMMLLTAVTFGGQDSLGALEHLPEEEAALLRHRAQEILQIPREKRIPALVQEIKRLVKDRRGQLWSAEPERLAALLQRERGALVEVVLRALPGTLADAVRTHLPPSRVKLSREVRPQVLDIVRWKLEEVLAREAAAQQAAGFKFSDVLQLQQRELLTVCDRLGARVLGPAMAGLPDAERDALVEPLPPDLRLLATKAVTANAPRKLPEEDARAQLEVHDGLKNLGGAIRSAGVQRLARACVAQSPEFAARMLEKYRGEFGALIAKWVREERIRPTARGDGGRTDIVMDLERLASRGLIERPVRLASQPPPRQSAMLPPPPGARKAAGAPSRAAPAAPADGRPAPRASMAGPAASRQGPAASGAIRRDIMAERAARNAGAVSNREPSRVAPGMKKGGDPGGSAVHRVPPRRDSPTANPAAGRREPEPRASRPVRGDPEGARIGPPPSRLGQRDARRSEDPETSPEPGRERSRVSGGESRVQARPSEDPSRVSRMRPRAEPEADSRGGREVGDDPEGSRVFRSRGSVPRARGGAQESSAPERPPRVLAGRATTSPGQGAVSGPRSEGTSVQRRPRAPSGTDRPVPPGAGGRGPKGGTR
ncbi:hypothetical protein JY651_25290 [Pyxidicoccus parkwayensis]|uniref:DUF2336 domain-containing protein n=1 Tax=Pyxidicoccus parkwayensis TaxID=2813578 RepID=A0ABX7NIS2_9BACT|nr:hypothetical protein [Pyxidicoccus parkwaysis]QSQ18680.1 hypothetical protein JY651_25290 [Pyxidicoccus parkwaysis]